MLQGVVDADEKDENEVTGRPMLSVHRKGGKLHGYTGVKDVGKRIPGNRRFDGVAVDQTNQIITVHL